MSIQRFQAPTSREAMAKARGAFGESAVILSSRATANGFEVVATAEENLSSLSLGSLSGAPSVHTAPAPPAPARPVAPAPRKALESTVEHDTETMAMSTLSFQDYVRERMLKRRREALEAEAAATAPAPQAMPRRGTEPLSRPAARQVTHPGLLGAPSMPPAPRESSPAVEAGLRPLSRHVINDLTPTHAQPAGMPTAFEPAPILTRERAVHADWNASMLKPAAPGAVPAQPQAQANIANELSALKSMIEDRFNMLTWLGTSRNNPMQSNLMLKLIRAGYSPTLVRSVLERLPADGSAADSVRWVMDVLTRNLKITDGGAGIGDEGGVVALIGATGVGKTTTAAKLAAQCVKSYGAQSVGLITLDTYRVAGYEQLRSYGRLMGVVAHLAHDRAALKDMLNLLAGKRLVLIDTAGLGQRDPRIQEMLEVLDMPGVKKNLVLNASSQGETLDDVLTSFKTKSLHGVVLSKVDEAVKLGPALDALIRHQVVLRGVANGQRVPEDWHNPDASQLVRTSMGSAGKSAYDPAPSELGFFFAQPAQTGMTLGDLRV